MILLRRAVRWKGEWQAGRENQGQPLTINLTDDENRPIKGQSKPGGRIPLMRGSRLPIQLGLLKTEEWGVSGIS